MRADLEAREHVRYLMERLNRANSAGTVAPELVDSLLDALPHLINGRDPARTTMVKAALAAVEAQNDLTRAMLDDHLRRALEVYLALPTPGAPAPQ